MTKSALHRPDINVHFARVISARAKQLGVEERLLLEAVRLSPDLLEDPRTRISPTQLGALIRLVWRSADDELMGFGPEPHRFGVFALMARQMVDSACLADALRYSVRFFNLTSRSIRWELSQGEETVLSLELLDPTCDSSHFIEELMLLIWHRFSNWLIGERIPLVRTELRFCEPPHSGEYRVMFPGPLEYGHSTSSIVFAPSYLRQSIVRSRRELRDYLQRLPDEWFIKQDFEHSISDRVLRVLEEGAPYPDLKTLASRWTMSSRTLHRRLLREGSSYRSLMEQVRREAAIQFLLETNSSVGQIARKLDMTEPAFSRAFRQWTGLAPLAYRRART